jgi:isoleucyl-tRNA synthetase
LQFCTSDPGNQKRFSEGLVRESVLPFLTVLANCKTFYEQAEKTKLKTKQIEDKWILSRLNTTIKQVTEDLEKYELDKALLKIMGFVVNDFSRTYIKITRDREDTKEILGEVLEKISLVLAPYAPYISEYVYQEFSKESVHLSSWPKSDSKVIDEKLELKFNISMEIIEKGLAERDMAQIGLKWPLAKATIYSKEHQPLKELHDIISKQLNVKEIKLTVGHKGETKVELDTELTPDLEAEGYAREISRKVQAARKNAGLVKTDKIELFLIVDEDFKELILRESEMIKKRTHAQKILIESAKQKSYDYEVEEKIKGKNIKILFNKI